jgi:hypothetical protein
MHDQPSASAQIPLQLGRHVPPGGLVLHTKDLFDPSFAGNAVVNVYINKEKNFAFVEFRTGRPDGDTRYWYWDSTERLQRQMSSCHIQAQAGVKVASPAG